MRPVPRSPAPAPCGAAVSARETCRIPSRDGQRGRARRSEQHGVRQEPEFTRTSAAHPKRPLRGQGRQENDCRGCVSPDALRCLH